jgi:hypothetical protein
MIQGLQDALARMAHGNLTGIVDFHTEYSVK